MTNNDRNVRTLIVCFSLAMMALVPMRFAEENNIRYANQVLGESTKSQIVLPNAEVDITSNNDQGKLEAPYDQIEKGNVLGAETADCIDAARAGKIISNIKNELNNNNLNQEQVRMMLKTIDEVQQKRCY